MVSHIYTVIVPVLVSVALLVSITILTSMCLFGIIVTVLQTKKAKGELIVYLSDDLKKQ